MEKMRHYFSEFSGKNELVACVLRCKKELWSIGFFSVIINLLMLTPSVYMLQVYDRVLSSGNKITLIMLTLIVIWLFISIGVVEWIRNILLIRLGAYLDTRINKRIFFSAFEGFLRQSTAHASQSLADLTLLRQFASGNALFAFFDAPWFPVYLLIIFLLHPWLGILALAGAIILILLAWLNQRLTHDAMNQAGSISAAATLQANTCLRQAEAIAAMGMQEAMYRKWLTQHEAFLQQQNLVSEKSALVAATTRFIRLALQSGVLGLGALLVLKGEITPGMMIAGSILSGRVLAPVDQLIAVWKGWVQAQQAWQRLSALLEQFPPAKQAMPLPPPDGNLRVENLSAKLPGLAKYPLRDISFELQPGDVMMVTGPSGGGKSTLARLLVGAAEPFAGSVRLDGADIHQYDPLTLGPYLGYLPQDIQLFEGTVAENIARFAEPDEEKIVAAARHAGIHRMILQLPAGYDTPLGPGGVILSGGQKQRLGLARALYHSPRLIVLDEPDASLDDEGKQALITAIRRQQAAGSTQIIITHTRLLLPCSNKILILNNGRISHSGTTQQFMQRVATPGQPLPGRAGKKNRSPDSTPDSSRPPGVN
ncbi:type I secretion system permease/ATPase [Tatumella sp. UBA2305]|uniref:type I secretion system permease/ATPase n=1 Tax=Tatumella sp. UBA2305 TaxID=1947647 RepID=UPI0025CF66AE|nr:type I secretion system permease/ATPase [Tatumella sp. UBA2305]